MDKSASKSGQGKAIYPNPYPRYLRRCGWRRDDNFGGGPVSVILSAWVALMAGQPQTVSVSSGSEIGRTGPSVEVTRAPARASRAFEPLGPMQVVNPASATRASVAVHGIRAASLVL